jgi:hypothetical protein
VSQTAEKNPTFKKALSLTVYELPENSTDVVRFWISADMVVTIAASLLSVSGIVLAL